MPYIGGAVRIGLSIAFPGSSGVDFTNGLLARTNRQVSLPPELVTVPFIALIAPYYNPGAVFDAIGFWLFVTQTGRKCATRL